MSLTSSLIAYIIVDKSSSKILREGLGYKFVDSALPNLQVTAVPVTLSELGGEKVDVVKKSIVVAFTLA